MIPKKGKKYKIRKEKRKKKGNICIFFKYYKNFYPLFLNQHSFFFFKN